MRSSRRRRCRHAGSLAATIADSNARLEETNARVREGTALAADAAAIEATLLQRQQDADDLQASRRAALDRLGTLTGQTLGDNDTLMLPDVATAVAQARQSANTLRARPEYEQFARTRDRLARQQQLTAAQERPRLSAYGSRRLRPAGAELHPRRVPDLRLRRRSPAMERVDLGLWRARA